jgi:hypothetical protein
MASALFALLHHVHRKSTIRWWEMENIVEQGSGRLPGG